MKIAAAYQNGEIAELFSQTPQFKLYTIDGNRISEMTVVDAPEVSSADAMAQFLRSQDVGILVCGRLNAAEQGAVMLSGIAPFPGAHGDADLQVGALAAGLFTPVTPEDSACDSSACDGNCAACRSRKENA